MRSLAGQTSSTAGGRAAGAVPSLTQSMRSHPAVSTNMPVLLPLPGAGPVPGAALHSVRNSTVALSAI